MTSPGQIAALYALQGLVGADRYDRTVLARLADDLDRRGADAG